MNTNDRNIDIEDQKTTRPTPRPSRGRDPAGAVAAIQGRRAARSPAPHASRVGKLSQAIPPRARRPAALRRNRIDPRSVAASGQRRSGHFGGRKASRCRAALIGLENDAAAIGRSVRAASCESDHGGRRAVRPTSARSSDAAAKRRTSGAHGARHRPKGIDAARPRGAPGASDRVEKTAAVRRSEVGGQKSAKRSPLSRPDLRPPTSDLRTLLPRCQPTITSATPAATSSNCFSRSTIR